MGRKKKEESQKRVRIMELYATHQNVAEIVSEFQPKIDKVDKKLNEKKSKTIK